MGTDFSCCNSQLVNKFVGIKNIYKCLKINFFIAILLTIHQTQIKFVKEINMKVGIHGLAPTWDCNHFLQIRITFLVMQQFT